MALLEEGNPAPGLGDDARVDLDALTYLAAIEQRSQDMTVLETNESREDDSRRKMKPWLVAAVVVVVIGMAVVVFNQINATPLVDSPGQIPLEGAENHPGAAEAFIAVEDAYTMFNAGDQAWIDIRMRGSNYGATVEDRAANKEVDKAFWRAVLAADTHDKVSGCISNGSGDWQAVVDTGVPTPTGFYFTCATAQTNSLLDVAGVASTFTYHFVVDDSGVVAMNKSGESDQDVEAFIDAFGEWLIETYPQTTPELLAAVDQTGFGFAEPETQTLAIQYAEEFVAQSDRYPIEATDS
jgi:hypothetical protein